MADLRLFIGIQVPSAIKAECEQAGQALAHRLPRGAVRWVRPEHMHLTLRFLGETPADKMPAIGQAMDAIAEGYPPFELTLNGLGCFPNCKRPRVIWIGLDERSGIGDSPLAGLKLALDAGLAALGWEPETKPYRAHLTLGRVKDEQAIRGFDWQTDITSQVMAVSAIEMIQSDLRPAGPIYTTRHHSELGGVVQ